MEDMRRGDPSRQPGRGTKIPAFLNNSLRPQRTSIRPFFQLFEVVEIKLNRREIYAADFIVGGISGKIKMFYFFRHPISRLYKRNKGLERMASRSCWRIGFVAQSVDFPPCAAFAVGLAGREEMGRRTSLGWIFQPTQQGI